jgi:hypothetical protein
MFADRDRRAPQMGRISAEAAGAFLNLEPLLTSRRTAPVAP